jgi:hypothetical protein
MGSYGVWEDQNESEKIWEREAVIGIRGQLADLVLGGEEFFREEGSVIIGCNS